MAAQNNKKPATLQPRAKNFNKTTSAPPLSTTSELLKPPRNLNSTSLPREPPHSLICKIWMHKSSVKRNHCGKYRSATTRTTQENDGIVVLIQLNYYCLKPGIPKINVKSKSKILKLINTIAPCPTSMLIDEM